MALTLADLQAKRDQLVLDIDVLRVQFGDRSVEYSDRQKALAVIDAEIAKQSPQSRQFTIQTSRGL